MMKLKVDLAPGTLHQRIVQEQLAPAADRDHRISLATALPRCEGRRKDAAGKKCPGLPKKQAAIGIRGGREQGHAGLLAAKKRFSWNP
jgi:hypothetical protein